MFYFKWGVLQELKQQKSLITNLYYIFWQANAVQIEFLIPPKDANAAVIENGN